MTRTPSLNRPIGVFDSGVGGLTVLQALRRRLPHRDFAYLGDTARVPYGRKPPQMVVEFAVGIADFLCGLGVDFLVVACNTASAVALPALIERSPVPVCGVIDPGVEAATRATRTGSVGVIGTKGTILSSAYQSRLEARGLRTWSQACPMLVHVVEEGLADSPESELLVTPVPQQPARDRYIDPRVYTLPPAQSSHPEGCRRRREAGGQRGSDCGDRQLEFRRIAQYFRARAGSPLRHRRPAGIRPYGRGDRRSGRRDHPTPGHRISCGHRRVSSQQLGQQLTGRAFEGKVDGFGEWRGFEVDFDHDCAVLVGEGYQAGGGVNRRRGADHEEHL